MGVDEPPPGHRAFQLHPKSPDVNINRAVSETHLAMPRQTEQFLSAHNPICAPRELGQETELLDREHQSMPPRPRDVVRRRYLQRSDLDHLIRLRIRQRQWLCGCRQGETNAPPRPPTKGYAVVTEM